MSEVTKAKLFKHGGSQAVRIPRNLRFPGNEVYIRPVEGGVLLEPVEFDVRAWLARLHSFRDTPFMEDGREQPEMPPDEDLFDQ